MHLTAKTTISRAAPELATAARLTAAGFAQPDVTPALIADVAAHLASGHLVYTLTNSAGPCGFAIFNYWATGTNEWVLYLSGIILDPTHQAHGLAERVIGLARIDAAAHLGHAPRYLAWRTASARMWQAGMLTCRHTHPNPTAGIAVPPELTAVLETITAQLGSPPADGTLRVPGCYGASLYGTSQDVHDGDLQQWWNSVCDTAAGDAMICIGELE